MPFYSKSELKQITYQLEIYLSKGRGQCFLIDRTIQEKIIHFAQLDKTDDIVLEIGPGLGLLTEELIKKAKQVIAIELDNKFVKFLRNYYNPTFIEKPTSENLHPLEDTKFLLMQGDALRIDWPKATKIVSNIPYQISGPLLFKILENWNYSKVILMVQEEFAERLIAKPNTKNYSRLSAAIGLFLHIEKLQNVSRYAFYPVPKVTSSIIQITAKERHISGEITEELRDLYLKFLEGIFPYKNKNLRKATKLFFENYPEYKNKILYLYNSVQPSEYGGILRRKVRSFSSNELYSIIEFGLTGNNNLLPT